MKADITISTGPQCSTGKSSGEPMKIIIVAVQLSVEKKLVGSPTMGNLMLKKMSPVKLLNDQ